MAVLLRSGKTRKMLEKEVELGMPLEQAIHAAFTRTQSLPATARELGVHVRTLYYWIPRLGPTVETKLVEQ